MDLVNQEVGTFLADNLKSLRRRTGFSQEELARKVGLNRGNIASYENGTAEPKICNLLKLSYLLGVSILDLTQKDLSEEVTYLKATDYFQNMSGGEREFMEEYAKKAEEIEAVLNSLHTCCQYKVNSQEELPKEVACLVTYFEQLHEAAQSLLNHHRSLINFVKDRL